MIPLSRYVGIELLKWPVLSKFFKTALAAPDAPVFTVAVALGGVSRPSTNMVYLYSYSVSFANSLPGFPLVPAETSGALNGPSSRMWSSSTTTLGSPL